MNMNRCLLFFLCLCAASWSGCSRAAAIMDPDLRECSGIAASRTQPGVLWAHNDSGNPPDLFAIGTDGRTLGRWRLSVPNLDWEDIAVDGSKIYIADTGNNNRQRTTVLVHRVREPKVGAASTALLDVDQTWWLTFPEMPFDCESLALLDGYGYLIEKTSAGPAGVYRFSLNGGATQTLARVAILPIDVAVCGADISADGRYLAVTHSLGVHLLKINGNMTALSDAPQQAVLTLDNDREACCFLNGGVQTASESRTLRWWSLADFARGVRELPLAATTTIAAAPAGVRVDGLLQEWQRHPMLPVSERKQRGKPAVVWAGWTPTGLFMAGIVPDKTLRPRVPMWFEGDCVELFIGSDATNRPLGYGAADTRCYVAFDAKPGGALTAGLYWAHDPPVNASAAQCAGTLLGKGYQFEAFIPWPPALQSEIVPGATIRFACSILSDKPKRNWYVGASNKDGVWSSPLLWAQATLAGAGKP